MHFAVKNQKSYKNVKEVEKRKENWKNAKFKVEDLNTKGGMATFAVNYTADLDDEEYILMLGLDTQSNPVGPLRTGFDQDDEIIFGPGLQAA